jgi:hypothetical protein
MLLSDLPAGEALDRVVDLSVNELLGGNQLEESNPSEWIPVLKRLLNISRVPDEKGKALITYTIQNETVPILLPSPAAKEIRTELSQTPDPVIHAYATIETLLPIPYQTTNRY